MSTNTTTNTNANKSASVVTAPSMLTADLLAKVGIASKVTAQSAAKARASIRQEGGYVPESASNELVVVAASVIDSSKAAARAGKAAAIGLALIEESEEYKRVLSPYGKPFKSASDFFKALFPSLADSTRRNYISVGRNVYLPAMRGELPSDLMFLANLEPGTAQQAVSVLQDENARKALPSAIKEIAGPTGKVSQSVLKAAVKVAKDKSGLVSKTDGTMSTEAKDAKAAADMALSEMRAAIVKLLTPDRTVDETVLSLDADNRKAWDNLLDKALETPDSAINFIKALKAMKL